MRIFAVNYKFNKISTTKTVFKQKSIYVIEKSFVGVFKAKHIYLWQIVKIT